MEIKELRLLLDSRVEQYNNEDFIELDPVSIPHLFTKKEDIEISGLLASIIAWGNRKMIVRNANRMMDLMGNEPYNFVMNADKKEMEALEGFCHRTFNHTDLQFFIFALRNIYANHGGLEKVFTNPITDREVAGEYCENNNLNAPHISVAKRSIINFRETLLETEHLDRVTRHVSNPTANSACKRINMYLKWMVRNDEKGVDFGIWNGFGTENLICPLDVHTGRIGRKLGLITRNQDDWKSAEELTSHLRLLDPKDPVKYDYALFGLGIFEKY